MRAVRVRRSLAALAALGLASGSLAGTGGTQAVAAGRSLPPVKHVFVIVLENESYASTFGNPAADPYLAVTLPAQGALLRNYYGTGHESNDNYTAMVSGQAPDPQNQGDCQYYTDFTGAGTVPPDQAVGSGCVYPASVHTVAGQLSSAGLRWKGYMEDMGNDPSREAGTCAHPPLNARDNTESSRLCASGTRPSGSGSIAAWDPTSPGPRSPPC